MELTNIKAKPFLKWAGGKTQLVEKFVEYFPEELNAGLIHKYAEPFVGGGAIFFHITQYYNIDELFISDINAELILAYKTIKKDVFSLIDILEEMQAYYYQLNPTRQKEYFYKMRYEFNNNLQDIDYTVLGEPWIRRTAQLIFLNRTCFNGLFRVNSKGEFNVPFGRYKNPLICSKENLEAVSHILQYTQIVPGDFTGCEEFIDSHTFVYFDPPYRPISKTANFTSYSRKDFTDLDQVNLASFFRLLDTKGAKLMLSNSDPKNEDPNDNFFEELYKDFRIERIKANRMINSVAEKRGAINELLILNY